MVQSVVSSVVIGRIGCRMHSFGGYSGYRAWCRARRLISLLFRSCWIHPDGLRAGIVVLPLAMMEEWRFSHLTWWRRRWWRGPLCGSRMGVAQSGGLGDDLGSLSGSIWWALTCWCRRPFHPSQCPSRWGGRRRTLVCKLRRGCNPYWSWHRRRHLVVR